MSSIGVRLTEFRRRAGMTLEDVAAAMQLAGRSSVQRFFTPQLETLSISDALRLADVLEGRGNPPIRRGEVLELAGGAERLVEIAPNDDLAPRFMDLPKDVPVYGTAMGTFRDEEGAQAIEQAFIDYSETIDFFPRLPAFAAKKGIYGIYVTGASMEPRWDPGDPAYVDPKRPPQIGDDVIVYLAKPVGDDSEPEAVLIKRLVKRSTDYVELEQYNPALRFRIETRRIKSIHRVIPRREYNGAR